MGPLRVKFWGTRGLISSPRPETAIFGGNTPCVQILYGDHLILVDSGFGCTNFGDELMGRILGAKEALNVHIFYTHFHWDHVQGLPFFKPIYFQTTSLNLHSPEPTEVMLANLDILFDGSYSPFESLMSMQAKVNLHQMRGPTQIAGLKVDYHQVDHGAAMEQADAGTYAYKFTTPEGESVTLITDHEARNTKLNRALVQWAKGTDILIHDGQFLEEEYLDRVGWGHSSAQAALTNALKIEPKLTLLTHHDPARNDRELQGLHRSLLTGNKFRSLTFEFAREEIIYEATRASTLRKVS